MHQPDQKSDRATGLGWAIGAICNGSPHLVGGGPTVNETRAGSHTVSEKRQLVCDQVSRHGTICHIGFMMDNFSGQFAHSNVYSFLVMATAY